PQHLLPGGGAFLPLAEQFGSLQFANHWNCLLAGRTRGNSVRSIVDLVYHLGPDLTRDFPDREIEPQMNADGRRWDFGIETRRSPGHEDHEEGRMGGGGLHEQRARQGAAGGSGLGWLGVGVVS